MHPPEGEHFEYTNYYDSYWKPFIEQMDMDHTPHCTRHTCISLLTMSGVDERIIKKIVGHKGKGVTQTVYTHIEIEELIKTPKTLGFRGFEKSCNYLFEN